jgi:hypothetical protein
MSNMSAKKKPFQCSKCGMGSYLSECVKCLLKGTDDEIKPIKNISNNIKSIMDIHKLKVIKNSKRPAFTEKKNNTTKKQYTWKILKPEEKINNDFLMSSNWGIICNKKNGILGVDLDCYKWSPEFGCHKSDEFYKKFGKDYIKRFNTYTQKTPTGGIHLVFLYDKDLNQTESTKNCKFGTGIDIRNGHDDNILGGGYLVGAGSVYKDKEGNIKKYELINDVAPNKMPEDLKLWLLENIYTAQEDIKNKKKNKSKIEKIEESIIKHVYKYKISDEELEEEIIKNLPKSYLEDYGDWFKFTSAMKTLDKYELWQKICKKYSGYDENNNNKIWQSINIKSSKYPLNYYVEHIFKIAKKYKLLKFVKYKPVPEDKKKPNKIINRKKLAHYENENEKDEPIKLELNKKNNNSVIQADTGTGKTTLFKKEIQNKKFISIVSRVSLGKEQYHNFNQNGIDCVFYANCWPDSGDSVITTIDSILCCNRIIEDIKNYTIFIDEFNSVLEYIIQADTCLKNTRAKCWKYLIHILKNAKNFVCVDADISELCFILLDYIGRPYNFIKNEYKHNNNVEAKEVYSIEDFIKIIKGKKKYMVACDSKKAAEYIYLETGKQAKLLTASTDKLEDETLDDYDKIIFSPSIIYGLDSSINRPVFCYHKENTISPPNMVQQIARCRDIKKLYFCFQKKQFTPVKFNTKEECDDYYLELYNYGNEFFDPLEQENNNNEKIFFEMLKYYYYKMDAYNSNKACHFKLIIEKRGFILNSKNKETKKITKDIAEDIKNKVMDFKLENFNIDSAQVQEFNEKYLGNLSKVQLLEFKDLFIEDGLANDVFKLKAYFEYGTKNQPLFNAQKEYNNLEDDDIIRKETTAENMANYLDCEEMYNKVNEQEDMKIKKIQTNKFKCYLIDKFKYMTGYKEIGRNILTIQNAKDEEPKDEKKYNLMNCDKELNEEQKKKFIKAYKLVFNYRGKKDPELNNKYDYEKFIYNMMKKHFGSQLFNKPIKKRDGTKVKYVYSINYDADILKYCKKLANYQRIKKMKDEISYKTNHYAFVDDYSDEE